MTKPINWLLTWLPLLKFAQAVCLALVIILLLEGRDQWYVYNVIYCVAFLLVFLVLLTAVLHYFDVTNSNQLPWHQIELGLNLLSAVACFVLAAVLIWDVWNMSGGRPENFRYHQRLAPHTIGLSAWTRRCSIVAASLVVSATLFVVTYLRFTSRR